MAQAKLDTAKGLFIAAAVLNLPTLFICIFLSDGIRGVPIDPDGLMGSFLLFVLAAPVSSILYGVAWYLGGRAYRWKAVGGLAILWLTPVLFGLGYGTRHYIYYGTF